MQLNIEPYKLMLFGILFLLFQQHIQAQNAKIDSLWAEWKNDKQHDTVRIDALINFAWDGYLYSYPDSTFYYAKMAYDYAESKGLKKQMGWASTALGVSSWYQSNMNKSIAYFSESTKIYEELGDKYGQASSLMNTANIYADQGNFIRAIESHTNSLKIYEQLGEKSSMADCYNNIGVIHHDRENYKEALIYFRKSLEIMKAEGKSEGISRGYNNVGSVYENLKNLEKAEEYYLRSLAIREESNNQYGIAQSLGNLGGIFRIQGKIEEAMEYHQKSLVIRQKLKNNQGISSSMNAIALNFIEQKKYRQAILYGNSALELGQEAKRVVTIRDASKALYEAYKGLGEFENAMKMHELFTQTRDSIISEKNQKEILRQEFKYQYDKKKLADSLAFAKRKEIDALAYQNKLDKELNIRRVLYAGLVFLFLLGFVFFRGYQRKKMVNKLIVAQRNDLARKNKEKTAMLKEIHHRVKNNLQVVNSLLRLQSREFEDEHAISMFKEAQDRVLSMALLHEKMYRSDDLKHIDVREHINLLVEDLIKSYAVGKIIDLDVNIEELDIGIQTLVPLGLIINEMISNALKYAFKGKNEGVITINIMLLKKDSFEMIIGDDGIGLKGEEESKGIGTKLIQIFTQQLNGTLERLEQPGTVFKLVFERIDAR